MSKWIAEFDLEDGDKMPEHMDLNYMGAKIDFHCRPMWIPVEKRLPIEEFEEGRRNGTVYDLYPCLVTRYSTHTDEPRTLTYVCKSYFDGEDFMLHGGYERGERIDTENTLAWMPLPQPYERSDGV